MGLFKSIAIVGGGTMGGGIAHVAAAAGIQVRIVEVNAERAEAALAGVGDELDREIAKWGMTESEKRAVLARISVGHSLEIIRDAPVVLEALQEDIRAKQNIWIEIENEVGSAPLKITHTATLSISEIAQPLKDPSRLIGLHFLPPVAKIPIVEIVRGLKTADATFNETRDLMRDLRKTPVEVTEYPGYITARVIVPMLNEAMYALMEGVASATDIDTAMCLGFGFSSGPLKMADRIGLDVVLKWMNSLFSELGDARYRPCPLLRKMVRAGQLGLKSGRGFFEYGRE